MGLIKVSRSFILANVCVQSCAFIVGSCVRTCAGAHLASDAAVVTRVAGRRVCVGQEPLSVHSLIYRLEVKNTLKK